MISKSSYKTNGTVKSIPKASLKTLTNNFSLAQDLEGHVLIQYK
jgi:hypothetical protein